MNRKRCQERCPVCREICIGDDQGLHRCRRHFWTKEWRKVAGKTGPIYIVGFFRDFGG